MIAWSNLARPERLELKRYAVECWGRDVALRYLEDVRDAATGIAATPDRAKALKGPLRVFRVRSHCLIAHADERARRVTIARVLHAAMDIDRRLP